MIDLRKKPLRILGGQWMNLEGGKVRPDPRGLRFVLGLVVGVAMSVLLWGVLIAGAYVAADVMGVR